MDRKILFVAHGGTIMSILARLGRPSWNIENTTLYYFTPPNTDHALWNITIIK